MNNKISKKDDKIFKKHITVKIPKIIMDKISKINEEYYEKSGLNLSNVNIIGILINRMNKTKSFKQKFFELEFEKEDKN